MKKSSAFLLFPTALETQGVVGVPGGWAGQADDLHEKGDRLVVLVGGVQDVGFAQLASGLFRYSAAPAVPRLADCRRHLSRLRCFLRLVTGWGPFSGPGRRSIGLQWQGLHHLPSCPPSSPMPSSSIELFPVDRPLHLLIPSVLQLLIVRVCVGCASSARRRLRRRRVRVASSSKVACGTAPW